MGMPLAIIAIKTIKSLIHWISLRARTSQAPLAEGSGDIPLSLKDFSHREFF